MATEKRLIDANALSEAVNGIGKDIKRPRAVELACLVLIADAPTIDAVEVVHGRWVYEKIYQGMKYVCSECGEIPECFEPNYCPNCGAKMDGDKYE